MDSISNHSAFYFMWVNLFIFLGRRRLSGLESMV